MSRAGGGGGMKPGTCRVTSVGSAAYTCRARAARWTLAAALAAAVFMPPSAVVAQPAVTDQQVRDAIDAMKRFLYARQDSDGGWESAYGHRRAYPGAMTALVTHALLLAGESPQQPQLVRAIDLLRRAEPLGTYQVALRAHVWGQLPDEYLPLLRGDVRWLANAVYADGSFGYVPPADSQERQAAHHWYDNSNTQYGVLGLWEGAKRGAHAGRRFWQQNLDYWLGAQLDDGGWAYQRVDTRQGFGREQTSYASMTCAGLTALYIAQQQMYGRRMTPEPRLSAAIDRGLAWMDRHFDGWTNIGGNDDEHRYYYVYSVERVALAGGLRFFNGQDWFERIAAQIVKAQLPPGAVRRSDIHGVKDTAFALMFLARGHVPVWITKLDVHDEDGRRMTDNRPNDLAALTGFLSDLGQEEINWQRVSLDIPVERWGASPVAYLAGQEAVNLTDAQAGNLRLYLDRGGLLAANADADAERFSASIRALGRRLYPGRSFQRLAADHPLYTDHLAVTQPGRLVIEGLSNGVRDVICLLHADVGYEWQSSGADAQSAAWRLGANLFTYGTERGNLLNRLVPPLPPAPRTVTTRRLRIVRPRHAGLWCAEPLAWEAVSRAAAAGGLQLALSPADDADAPLLADLARAAGGLAHITGVEPLSLSDDEIAAMRQFAVEGGTILIETIGGRGEFALSLERQLAAHFGGAAMPLEADHPLLTGAGLPGGHDVGRAVYRPYAVLRLSPGNQPRLLAFFHEGRPAVLLSSEDLSLGMLGVRRWGILGYETEYARQLMMNLALWAAR